MMVTSVTASKPATQLVAAKTALPSSVTMAMSVPMTVVMLFQDVCIQAIMLPVMILFTVLMLIPVLQVNALAVVIPVLQEVSESANTEVAEASTVPE